MKTDIAATVTVSDDARKRYFSMSRIEKWLRKCIFLYHEACVGLKTAMKADIATTATVSDDARKSFFSMSRIERWLRKCIFLYHGACFS